MNLNRYVISIALLNAIGVLPVFAQSNVTVYGLIDLAITKQSDGVTKLDRGYLNWLGFRGNEDLGSGNSATFNLMTRFNADTGAQESQTFWHGESTVGLKNNSLGEVRLGRALTPMWALKYQYEPWGDSWMTGSVGAYQATSRYITNPAACVSDCPGFARLNNGVFYDSPNINGFDVHVGLQMETEPNAQRKASGLSTNYANGPFTAMLSWETNTANMSAVFLGASYDFGAIKAMGSVGQSKVENGDKQNSYVLAATAPLGASNAFRAGYGKNSDTGDHKMSLGLQHFFSKRTQVYADVYNEKTVNDVTGYAVGIQHAF